MISFKNAVYVKTQTYRFFVEVSFLKLHYAVLKTFKNLLQYLPFSPYALLKAQ